MPEDGGIYRFHVPPVATAAGEPLRKEEGPAYAELVCRSSFSFLRGASHPEELVERAADLGYTALAITDRNTLAGVVRAHVAAKERGLCLIIGAEIVPDDAPAIAIYPTDRAAYGRLARLITTGRLRTPKGQCQLRFDDLAEFADGLLAVVLDCAVEGVPSSSNETDLERYRELFGDRLYLAAAALHGHHDAAHLESRQQLARRLGVPLLATNNVHYHEPNRRFLQDVLVCIREHCTIEQAGRRLFPNAERYLKPPDELARLFDGYPDAVARTLEIAERCRFSLDELRYEYPEELCPDDLTPAEYLTQLTWLGARQRYPDGVPDKVRRLVEHELKLIADLAYEPYFLTVWDIVRFARSRDILCQGRGSAANSAVCYCLGVTSVDPDRIDMLFERFVSRERNEPPDIDVDFEHERREEVFQYIYDKYTRERAGIVAEVITYRPRSAVRDVGKALGLSLDRVDTIAKSLEWWSDEALPDELLRDAGIDPRDRTIRLLVGLVKQILGFPRHLSQHVGGFVITRSPLCEMVPLENGAMPNRTFIEWNKDDIDALGILKVDCLSLGMLTAIHKCFAFINHGELRIESRHAGIELRNDSEMPGRDKAHRQSRTSQPVRKGLDRPLLTSHFSLLPSNASLLTSREVVLNSQFSILNSPAALALHTVPAEDPAVYDMICKADTLGVFQVESRAQMSMLPRLRPRCFYDLVIEVAIVRPGPIQGEMVHPYLRRRDGREKPFYPAPEIERVLSKTLGVPLFQEQAMQLAIVAAGFTPGEADQLRRSMGVWRRVGVIEKFRTRLIEGMRGHGLPEEFAERVFEQIRGFGAYGFPESHAASFALLVYVSCWLKRYHPGAYCAAMINSQPLGFYAPAQLVRDAQSHGVEVRPVDVNHSTYDCTLEPNPNSRSHRPEDPATWGADGPAVRLGMRLVKGVTAAQVAGVERARQNGRFASVVDLRRRSGASRATLARLAAADACRSLGLGRREALWEVLALEDPPPPLFADLDPGESRPSLPRQSRARRVVQDYETTGLSVDDHPIALVRDRLRQMNIVEARALKQMPARRRVRVAGLVLVRQRPGTAKGVLFYTLEDETGIANLIVRPPVYERYRRAARGAVALMAEGQIERQGEVIHVMVEKFGDLSVRLGALSSRSRDFH